MLNVIEEIKQKKNSSITNNDNNKYDFLLNKLHPKNNPEIPYVI